MKINSTPAKQVPTVQTYFLGDFSFGDYEHRQELVDELVQTVTEALEQLEHQGGDAVVVRRGGEPKAVLLSLDDDRRVFRDLQKEIDMLKELGR